MWTFPRNTNSTSFCVVLAPREDRQGWDLAAGPEEMSLEQGR